jgi:hypothetical protein
MKVRSEPTLARTEGSEGLKRTPVTDSAEVENVISITGVLLRDDERGKTERQGTYFVSSHICTIVEDVANNGSVV